MRPVVHLPLVPVVITLAACAACGAAGALVALIDTSADAGNTVDATTLGVSDASDATLETGPSIDAEAGGEGGVSMDAMAPDDAGLLDADAGPPGDGALGPFSAPTIVDAVDLPDANNTDPSMTSDWHELYFVSDRSGNQDIWVSRRDAADAAWGTPSAVAELNTPMAEQSPGVSFDGLTMWFARSPMPGQPQIWVTTRTAEGQAWSTPSPVTELNGAGTEISSKVDEDSLIMFFESTRSGSGQLYASARPNAQAAWGTPTLLMGLGPAGSAADPFVASYGLAVWFASTQSGGQDLYFAQRVSVDAPFGQPIPLTELNTPASEADPALSADFRYILFSSDRSGNAQIYQSRR